MRIDRYFQAMGDVIAQCLVLQTFKISYEKRGADAGMVRGELTFVDGTILHFREYVEVETQVVRLMYTYHYMDAHNQLIFRYDNTGHHRKLGLPTYPHHKHQGAEDNVVPSSAPDLAEVLEEITRRVGLP